MLCQPIIAIQILSHFLGLNFEEKKPVVPSFRNIQLLDSIIVTDLKKQSFRNNCNLIS